MTANFNKTKYGDLLMQTLPSVITSEDELDRLTQVVDHLITKGIREDDLSPEESILLDLLASLIGAYEDEHYPIADAPPHHMLKFLMDENGLRQADLLPVFGSSGIASEVVNGKRSISKAQAKKLAAFFKVSTDLFI